jgi:hypothetical protein
MPTRYPSAQVKTSAVGRASQKESPYVVIRIPVEYPPIPKNPAWARESCPARPSMMSIP